jgi:hypothetical protein
MTASLEDGTMGLVGAQRVLDQFVDLGMKRRESEVHEAVADVFGRLSEVKDCSREVHR